jgi:hypothetical protein
MRVLELFSGSGSIKKVCEEKGYECISLDLKGADINIDILKWDYINAFPVGYFDYIHASPPCHTFSNLRRGWIGRTIKEFGDIIITHEILDKDMIDKGLPLLRKAQDIIFHFEPTYWTIENPQGKMKNFMNGIPHYIIDYCMYSDWGYRKRTYFWTNIEGFEPKKCDRKCGNMVEVDGRKLHRNNCGNTERLKILRSHNIQVGTSLTERYRIPLDLINELFDAMDKH